MKFVSTRLKSSSASAYTGPNTASASVLPLMCGRPQSSRVIVIVLARCSRAASFVGAWALAVEARANRAKQSFRMVGYGVRVGHCKMPFAHGVDQWPLPCVHRHFEAPSVLGATGA